MPPAINGANRRPLHFVFQRLTHLGTDRPEDGLGIKWHLGQPHPDRVVYRVGYRWRWTEGRDLADALGAERAIRLVVLEVSIFHNIRHIVEARDLVIGKRSVRDLAAIDVHFLEHREANVHQCSAGNLRLYRFWIDRLTAIHDIDQLEDFDMSGFGVDLNLGATAGNQPERRDIRALPILGLGEI